jgi:uncharacterized protein (UPF0303 family)
VPADDLHQLKILRDRLREQEASLRFSALDHGIALELGLYLLARAREQAVKLTVEVTSRRQQIFKFAMPGTQPSFDDWIARKRETVYHFGHSSWLVKIESGVSGVDALAAGRLDPARFVLSGGGFPLLSADGEVFGTATASGLAEEIDHEFITQAIARFLANRA